MLGSAAMADAAREAVREEAAAQIEAELLVDVLRQTAAVRARSGQVVPQAVKLGGDDAVKERGLGLAPSIGKTRPGRSCGCG